MFESLVPIKVPWSRLVLPSFLALLVWQVPGYAGNRAPRVVILPAQMRNSALLPVQETSGPDPMEAAITETVSRALMESGSCITVDFSVLAGILPEKDKALVASLSASGTDRPTTLPLSREARLKAGSVCDLIILPQFDFWRIPSTGRVRISDISARILYTGVGIEPEEYGLQQFVRTSRLRFPKEFPMESEVPGAVYENFAKGLAANMQSFFDESRRLAMDVVMEDLDKALKAETPSKEDIRRLLADAASLDGAGILDPGEAYLLGKAGILTGNPVDAVTWLTMAKEGGQEPLEQVLADLGKAQGLAGQHQGAATSLEEAYRLNRRKGIKSEGLLPEILAQANMGGLKDKAAEILEIMAVPRYYSQASDTERINWLTEAAGNYREEGRIQEATRVLTDLGRNLLAQENAMDSLDRESVLIRTIESLRAMGKGSDADTIRDGLTDEAIILIKAGRLAEGLSFLQDTAIAGGLSPRGWFWKAFGHSKQGQRTGAEEAYLKALAGEPGLAPALYNLRLLYLADNRNEDIIRLLTPWMEGKGRPVDPWIPYALSQALIAKGNHDDALSILSTAKVGPEWSPRFSRAAEEARYLKSKTALGVDTGLTPEAFRKKPSASLNKAMEWQGTAGKMKEGKAFNELQVNLPSGLTSILRFYGDKPNVPEGSPIRFLGRITRVEESSGTFAGTLYTPVIACTGVASASQMDTMGAPRGIMGEMTMD